MAYDSTDDTKRHIEIVRYFMYEVIFDLTKRSTNHDKSKFEEPEKSIYDEYTPLLRDLTYGSQEYKDTVAKMGEGVQHHYKHNRHHPEHFENGIDEMNLADVIEMVCDWKAASRRHADGDVWASLEINRKRFGISEQLFSVIKNTVRDFGW